jgi:hypothetical protein
MSLPTCVDGRAFGREIGIKAAASLSAASLAKRSSRKCAVFDTTLDHRRSEQQQAPTAESTKTPACKAWKGEMGSRNPQTYLHDPRTLRALRQAFYATWLELQARDPFRDFERDSELKTAINQKLWALAKDGVTDPIELREWALESLRLR